MPLTPALIKSYERAFYALDSGTVLRIGVRDAGVDRLLEARGVATAAFVTAANPRGEACARAENDAAMAALRASLALPWLPGEGRDPEGRWSAEPSLLVLGMTRADAEALGRRLEQNAIVFIERGRAPELVLLRRMRLVLDTQVWLDWLVFDEPALAGLRATISDGRAEVVIDPACRAELERVLAYPLGRSVDLAACLEECDKVAIRIDPGASVGELPACRDPDDQKFLTLAAATRADCLVTRDRELLRLARRCEPRFAILPPGAFPVN
ncbi:MAG: putative toxin-antitoxin system toxin component, PIN family [Burkholderiales bacterium]